MKVPEDMIAIGDTSPVPQGTSIPNLHWITAMTWLMPPGSVHRGGANILFCDGHVQWYLPKDITFPLLQDPLDPIYMRVAPMWDNSHQAHQSPQ